MTGPAIAAVLAALLVLGGTATAAQLTSNGQPVDFVRWEPVTPTFRYDALLPDPTRRDGIDGGGLDAVEPATRLHLHVRADGTLEETALRTRMTLRGAAAAGPATLGFEVSAGTETATITEAYTLSPTDDRQPVDPAAIEVHPRPGNRLFSDVSEVVVPFPGTAGDGAIAVLVTRTVVRAGGVQVPWSRVYHPQAALRRERFQLLVSWDEGVEAPAIRSDDPGLACRQVDVREMVCLGERYAPFSADPDELDGDVRPAVVVAAPATWGDLAAALRRLVDGAADSGGSVDEALDGLLKDAGLRDLGNRVASRAQLTTRLARIHAFVSGEIRNAVDTGDGGGLVPRPAAVTLARRYGDATDKVALFVNMARRSGFRAHAVLTSSRRRDPARLIYPAIAWFDHMIACAGVPGAFEYCVDLTDPHAPLDVQAGILNGGLRFDLTEAGAAPSNFPQSRYDSNLTIETRRELAEDGRISERQRRRFLGGYGVRMRGDLRAKPREQREAEMIDSFRLHVRDGGDLNVRLSGLDDTAAPVTIDTVATYRDGFDPTAVLDFAVQEPWLGYELARIRSVERRREFAFPGFRFLARSVVVLPPNQQLLTVGPTLRFDTDFGSMSRRYTVNARQIDVETIVDMPATRIAPDQIAAFNRFLDVMLSNAMIRFESAPPTLN